MKLQKETVVKGSEYYSMIAQEYQDHITKDPFWRQYHQRRMDKLNLLIATERSSRILDFGCGTGENVIKLLGSGHTVSGIDAAPSMVAISKEQLMKNGYDPSLVILGDVKSLKSYESGQFDIVYSLNVLPFLSEEEEEEFYLQAKRITAPSGVIAVSHTNELVDLVTFNRYTVEFWRDRIIPGLSANASEAADLLGIVSSHLTHPDIPSLDTTHKSERDVIQKRRANPIDYPEKLRKRFGLLAEEKAFTYFSPCRHNSWKIAIDIETAYSNSKTT